MRETNTDYHYQFGGSLPPSAPTYVNRKADRALYQGILAGQFCYVLNSRQMGKSSLRVQTIHRLKWKGIRCATVDLTAIGSQEISADRWYAGIAYTLASSFNLLDRFDLGSWWCERNFLSSVQRLGAFVQVLLEQIPHPITIFVDEIDSILRLNFPTDDFFAWIRSCYEQRGDRPEYRRLTWVLLGVATPSELMKDSQRTPFGIGTAIDLRGFQLEECGVLAQGLGEMASDPRAVLKAILSWTRGQPFLTQKLCQLVRTEADFIAVGDEKLWVEKLVRSRLIHNWEAQDEPEHLRSIRDRLLQPGESRLRLLRLYQHLLTSGEIPANDSPEQMALRLSGLVVKSRTQPVLRVYNPLYAAIFNTSWDWVDAETRRILQQLPSPRNPPTPPTPESSFDEQLIYDHFLYCVRQESSERLLERFRQLFIEGTDYPDSEVKAALERIIAFLSHEQQFQYLLYRCCTIAINHWRIGSKQRSAIAELVSLLQQRSQQETPVSALVKRLEKSRILFLQSKEFLGLKRLREQILEWQDLDRILELKPIEPDIPLNQLIGRYPYLYSYRLISEISSLEHRQEIRQRQAKRQRQFELDLSRYATYLMRQSSNCAIPHSVVSTGKSLANPTLLSDEQLYYALQQFVGKIDGSYTHQDLAQLFLSRVPRIQSYQAFKAALYEYLIAAVDPRYGRNRFYQRLGQHLKNTFPENDYQPPDEVLIMRTCSRLFDFLVESPEHPNYYLFIDLISNLGPTQTMELLLKIILLSGSVRPHLEHRFFVLFNYYDTSLTSDIRWLVDALENLNIALVANFGDIDLSFIKDSLT